MTAPRTFATVLDQLATDSPNGAASRTTPFPTGLWPLDAILEGGLRAHDLVLLGGVPGVGKTVAALQMARQMASTGSTAIYACFEHDESELLVRLLLMELGAAARPRDTAVLDRLRLAVRGAANREVALTDIGEGQELLEAARTRVADYADRLWLVPASSRHTGLEQLEQLVTAHGNGHTALFVDYLQKVAVRTGPTVEAERISVITAGLKELALSHAIAVVAVVAVVATDHVAPHARRRGLHHLRASAALACESDVVLMLNEKLACVSTALVASDPVRAETFRDYVVLSIEKNRGGPPGADLEFRKDLAHFRFDPTGEHVAEQLLDARVDNG
ncbi:MAG: DnaB-like helicase C-terminal domain-containing protein [Egibacteraceae bacterium]